MLDPNTSKTALHNLFRRRPIAQIADLYRVLRTHSPMSVFRRLTSMGYFSSYTHRGRYYTLREIPRFDEFGLWHYGGVGFCQMRTLKAAVTELVEKSEVGRTSKELQDLLRVRVRNELIDRVRTQRIGRKALNNKKWLYVSANASRAAKQWVRRQAQMKQVAEVQGPLTAATTIEVLVEVLQSGRVVVTPQEVVHRLHQRGVILPLQHVQWVFERYELGKKKRGPDLRRSRCLGSS